MLSSRVPDEADPVLGAQRSAHLFSSTLPHHAGKNCYYRSFVVLADTTLGS
jgi:hypothetical protein